MSTKSVRIKWVDIAKFVCIFFVIVTHLESNTKLLSLFYNPFMLTVFFFVSGYVYNPKYSFCEMFRNKLRTLFIPWLVFSVFNLLLAQLLSFNEHGELIEELLWNFLQIRGKGDGLWFIAALFVSFIPFYYIINCFTKCNYKETQKITVLIGVIFVLYLCSVLYEEFMDPSLLPWNSSALPWHIEYIFQAMFFMTLGYLYRVYFETTLDNYFVGFNYVLLCGCYLILAYLPCIAHTEDDIVYQTITKLIGIIVVVYGCKKVKSNKFVSFVGQNTLIYFALHGKVYSVFQKVFCVFVYDAYYKILDNALLSSVFAVLLALLVEVALVIPTVIVHKWFPFVLGKSRNHIKQI